VIPITPQTVSTFLGLDRVAKPTPLRHSTNYSGANRPRLKKYSRLMTLPPVAMPKCPHGVRLTKAEYIFAVFVQRTPVLYADQMGNLTSPIRSRLSAFQCNRPVFIGCPLSNKKDAKSLEQKERVSQNCPECNPQVTNPHLLNAMLQRKGLSVNASRALLKNVSLRVSAKSFAKPTDTFLSAADSHQIEALDTKEQFGSDLQTSGRFG